MEEATINIGGVEVPHNDALWAIKVTGDGGTFGRGARGIIEGAPLLIRWSNVDGRLPLSKAQLIVMVHNRWLGQQQDAETVVDIAPTPIAPAGVVPVAMVCGMEVPHNDDLWHIAVEEYNPILSRARGCIKGLPEGYSVIWADKSDFTREHARALVAEHNQWLRDRELDAADGLKVRDGVDAATVTAVSTTRLQDFQDYKDAEKTKAAVDGIAGMVQGIKADSGKPRMDLLDPYAMEQMAKVLTFGAAKYDAHNWRKGIAFSRLLAAVLRHIFAYLGGEDNDPETGLSHLSHAMCGLMFVVGLKSRDDCDDRRPKVD